MVCDVPGPESEFTRLGIFLFGLPLCDFGILDHAVLSLAESDNANGFRRIGFRHDFSCAVGLFVDTVANEDGIRYLHKAVVDAVAVDVPDLSCGEIGKDRSGGILWFGRNWLTQSSVEATVTVRRNGDMGFGVKENLSVHR